MRRCAHQQDLAVQNDLIGQIDARELELDVRQRLGLIERTDMTRNPVPWQSALSRPDRNTQLDLEVLAKAEIKSG